MNLGGTAIGTTVTAHPDYPALAVKYLAELTGLPMRNSEDLIAATSDCGGYVAISSAMKSLAVKLTKVCNDLRLLASGPRCGFQEVNLPQMQPGSSIMPGKVNPVELEAMNQAYWFGHHGHVGCLCWSARIERDGTPDYLGSVLRYEGHDQRHERHAYEVH